MCGFYQTLTKYKVCGKKTHMFVKNQTCVSFSIQVVLLFVFALVFEFLMFDIIHYIYIYHFSGARAISDVKNTFKTAFKKSPVWEFPHMCGKTHTRKKTNTAKTTPKQINFSCVDPLKLRIPCRAARIVAALQPGCKEMERE